MNKLTLALLTPCLLTLSCQSFGMEMDEDPASNVSSLTLPDDSISKINGGRITAQGIEIDLNEETSKVVSNPNGACLAYSAIQRKVFDVTSEEYYKPLRNLNPNSHPTDTLYLRAEPTGNFANLGKCTKELLEKIQKALQGDSEAQTYVGTLLYQKNNVGEAALWLEKAIDQNNPIARYKLGIIFEKIKNYPLAKKMYQTAQSLGYIDSILALARINRLEGNEKEALNYYEMHDIYRMYEENQSQGSI